MAGQYELKKFLMYVANTILKEYFERICWNPTVDWEQMGAKVDPLFEAIRDAPDDIRARINQEFQLINEMATEGGIRTLVEEGRFRGLDIGSEIQGAGGLEDQVLRVFLDHPAQNGRPSLFDVARRFNKADNLPGRSWRKRSGLPTVEHAQAHDDEVAKKLEEGRKRLEEALQSYYRVKEGRGFGCKVDHWERGDKLYWFAYVRDYDSVNLEWGDSGLERRGFKPVFEVIFVHSNDDRSLDIYVKGDKNTAEELQTLWARAVLETEDLGTPPERGVEYELNVLKTKRHFKFQPDHGIKEVRISSLRLSLIGDRKNRRITLQANTRRDSDVVFTFMDDVLSNGNLPLDVVNITQAVINFVFYADSRIGTKTITARVSHPNSCSLKYEPKEEIARKYLQEWGIDVSGCAQSDTENH